MGSDAVQCPGCGARLKLPPSIPAGKDLRCPKCREVVISAPTDEESLVPVLTEQTVSADPLATDAAADPLADPSQATDFKTCPYCSETIRANAVKCRHCGEFLDGRSATPSLSQPVPQAAVHKARTTSNDVMTPAEYIVATLLCPVGIGVGVIWAAQKQAKAKMMLIVSSLSTIIAVAGTIICVFLLGGKVKEVETAAPAGLEMESQVFTEEMLAELGAAFQEQPLGQLPAPSSIPQLDLEKQPPVIQRALQANVSIETSAADELARAMGATLLGSGVVIQRDDEFALILTNRHVVDLDFAMTQGATRTPLEKLGESVTRPIITYISEQSNPGTVKWFAPDGIDLALIQAVCPQEIEPITWYPPPEVQYGDELFAVGNPVNLGWTFTKGVVSATRTQKHGTRQVAVIQTDASIAGGSSGGGLYTKDGTLVGINATVVDPLIGGGGQGFAIQASVLAELKPDGLRVGN